ncbi:hypothetical protein [Dietzia sp. MNB45]|uniref:hypothetical protein n=1 Tax=Dietzia sp. MNB45 TaxID=3238800 RepID=UPI003F7FE93E
MTGMEHAIEQVAKVVEGILGADPQIAHEMRGDEPDRIARALAAEGLLAAAPLREEWADTARAEAGRRWGWPSTVKPNSEMSPSDWLDEGMASGFVIGALWAVDSAEGDGRAEQ